MMNSAPESDQEPSDFTPLTAEQAQALREKNTSATPWQVVAAQVLVGMLVSLAAWLLTGRSVVAWSAACGALAVVIPAALFARGVTSKFASVNPAGAVLSFFVWELVKILVTVAVMYMAHRLVSGLSWPAMLVGLVVTMKVYWLALGFKRRAGAVPNLKDTSK